MNLQIFTEISRFFYLSLQIFGVLRLRGLKYSVSQRKASIKIIFGPRVDECLEWSKEGYFTLLKRIAKQGNLFCCAVTNENSFEKTDKPEYTDASNQSL